MHIALYVMFTTPEHPLAGMKESRRIRRGDIVSVYRASECPEPPASTGRLIFIRIRNVPNTRPYGSIKRRLTKKISYTEIIDEGNEPPYPVTHIDRMQEWSFQFGQLTAQQRTAIRDNREIVMEWVDARPLIRRKSVINRQDRLQDNLDTELQEEDFD